MKNKIKAFLTSALVSISALPLSSPHVNAEINLPDWVPQNLTEVIEFRNTYGTTHIGNITPENDMLCIVVGCDTYKADNYLISGVDNALWHETFINEDTDTQYDVYVITEDCKSPVEFYIEYKEKGKTGTMYTFSADGSCHISETDIYSWLPDCYAEYESFKKQNGIISAVDDYVVFLDSDNGFSGYRWGFLQNGDGLLERDSYALCSRETEYPISDSTSYKIELYKPVKDGIVNVTLNEYYFSEEPNQTINKTFEISSNCTEIKETEPIGVKGDVNSDGMVNLSDAVSLSRFILGMTDINAPNRKNADFNDDDIINSLDLCLLKNKLINSMTSVEEPDVLFDFRHIPFYTLTDLFLYTAPDENADKIAVVPQNAHLEEKGCNENNNYWVYTEYNGVNGWLKINDEDGNSYVIYEMTAKKPVIYLYPEQETDVHIELDLKNAKLSTTYPKYNNGWDVKAYPDGTIENKSDGTHHSYLFWDSRDDRTRYDFSKGFCVKGSDTENFLKEKLTYMGLTESEMNEFIVYWLPLMEHNKYNFIAFQTDAYTESAQLNITPTPDSLCRIFMAYIPLDEEIEIEPQELETFERHGFTVVEWGGSVIK